MPKGYSNKTGLPFGIKLGDDFTCQDCGSNNTYVTAHHIKSWVGYPEYRYDIDNGKTLCEPCHRKTDNYGGRHNAKTVMV